MRTIAQPKFFAIFLLLIDLRLENRPRPPACENSAEFSHSLRLFATFRLGYQGLDFDHYR
jgi:hypothetical protein